ncbi:VOC family protein [bacterium SCSIO 12741]|nr:VOC family protein [bacterium SCSIO 12741]
MANVINWFEIPAKNFDRACKFYGAVLDGPVQEMEMNSPDGGDFRMGFLPGSEPGVVGGAVVTGEGMEPGSSGALVYLNGGDDLSIPLGRVEAAGGTITIPKTSIGENGFFAQFMDPEGNRIAFHSMG